MADRHFGPIPNVEVGAVFDDRAALAQAGIHKPRQAGISGSGYEGDGEPVGEG
jgi:putative restriction endonuclease